MNMAIILYVFLLLCLTVLGIPELQRCADPYCKVAISEATATVTYIPNVEGKVYFRKGDKVVVYGKTDGQLWIVEVDGKRGFAQHGLLKEEAIFNKKLEHVVPIEVPDESVVKSDSSDSFEREPLIESSYDVIEGTTIFVNSSDNALTKLMSTSASEMASVGVSASETFDPKIEKKHHDVISSPAQIQVRKDSFKVSHTRLESDDISTIDAIKYTLSENELESSKENIEHLYQRFGTSASEDRDTPGKMILENTEKKGKKGGNMISEDNASVSEKDDGGGIYEENGLEGSGKFENENRVDASEETYKGDEDIDAQESNEESDESDLEEAVNGKSERDFITLVADRIGNDDEMDLPSYSQTSDEGKSLESNKDGSVTLQTELKSQISEQGDETNDKSLNITEVEDDDLPDKSSLESSGSSSLDYLHSLDSQENTSSSAAGTSTGEERSENVEEGLSPAEILLETPPSTELPLVNELQNIQETTNSEEEILREETIFGEEKSETLGEISGTQEDRESEYIQIKIGSDLNKMTLTQPPGEKNYEAFAETFNSDVHSGFSSGEPSFCTDTTDKCPESVFGYSSVSNLDNVKIRNANDESAAGQIVRHPGRTGISRGERDQDNMTPGNIDEPSEVQGTCEAETSGCILNDELAEEITSIDAGPGWFAAYFETLNMDVRDRSFGTLLYLLVTAVSVVVFTLGYYYTEKQRRDSLLIAKISTLEKALMIACQEKIVLNDELENTKDKLSYVNSQSVNSDETSSLLQVELEKAKNARLELEVQIATLEKELEAATEAGLELNRMMSELLSAQHGSDTLLQSVEHLQHQLDSQQNTISSMNARLTAKNLENQKLQSQLNASSTRVKSLEEQLAKALENKFADSERLHQALDDLQDTLEETREALATKEGEVAVLRESLAHAECLSSGAESSVSLEVLLNVGNLRAQIDSLNKERSDLTEKLQGEEDARKLLEDHMKIVSEEVSTLRTKYEEADHDKIEAQTRLEVLSSYFREKETQLQKELGLQEAMCIQKEGDALTTNEQIRTFKEEVESYKAQNEILKKEIIDQERGMKSQIASLEKKAHENWVAARQAERRLEECKQEASQLRNRLTLSGRRIVGTMPGPEMGKSPDRELEYNGEMSSSPAHLGESQELPPSPMHYGLPGSPPLLPLSGQLPPVPFSNMPLFLPPGAPPLPFPLPPPPGNIFPEDLRPPPLGRMSSPPPETLSSFSPFDNSPPISPLGRPYRSPIHYDDSSSSRYPQSLQSNSSFTYSSFYPSNKWDDSPRSSFRPLHRDSPHEPKGSTISSGHSSESLEKGSRHSGRV